MKRKLTYSFILVLLFLGRGQQIAYCQNIILNPSFEYFTSCFTGGGQINLAFPWYDPNSGTSDCYNECSSNQNASVPNNYIGSQYPRTGSGYAGFGISFQGIFSVREYIAAPLKDSLKPGTTYCVEFYVSLGDSSLYGANGIGVHFSKDSISHGDWSEPMPFIPQIEEEDVVIDTSGWVLISGQYIAEGGEKYIAIGNFRTNSNTLIDTVYSNGFQICGYYYIDDVFVGKCADSKATDTLNTSTIPNAFSPNSDGHSDLFMLHGWKNQVTEFSILIYNRWGEKVFESDNPERAWDGTYNGKLMDNGVFVYYINATLINGKKIIKKGNISLIR